MRPAASGNPLGIASFWVRGIADALAAEQLDVVALFREAGLNANALSDPDARFPSDGVNRLWNLAVVRSGNPAVGLASARVVKPASFDVVAYTMMSAPNLLNLLDRLERYLGIVSDAASATVKKARSGYRLVLVLLPQHSPAPWQRVAFDLLEFLSFCRWVTGREIHPLALELSYPPTRDMQPYLEAFGCEPRFLSRENALLFSLEDTMRPLPTAHRLLSIIHERVADDHLNRLSDKRISLRVRAAIMRHLPDGELSRGDIANVLMMSKRTMHRRLAAENTSFQRLLDETRCELAEGYLTRRDLSLADIAYLLGFKNQSSFNRSAKRWFGETPGAYRRRSTT